MNDKYMKTALSVIAVNLTLMTADRFLELAFPKAWAAEAMKVEVVNRNSNAVPVEVREGKVVAEVVNSGYGTRPLLVKMDADKK